MEGVILAGAEPLAASGRRSLPGAMMRTRPQWSIQSGIYWHSRWRLRALAGLRRDALPYWNSLFRIQGAVGIISAGEQPMLSAARRPTCRWNRPLLWRLSPARCRCRRTRGAAWLPKGFLKSFRATRSRTPERRLQLEIG